MIFHVARKLKADHQKPRMPRMEGSGAYVHTEQPRDQGTRPNSHGTNGHLRSRGDIQKQVAR